MLFYQYVCLLLTLATVVLYLAATGKKWRQWVLLGASCIFYTYSGIDFFLLLLGVILVNHFAAKLLQNGAPRLHLALIIFLNAAVLFFYKYIVFSIELLGLQGFVPEESWLRNMALPLGISFYTFQLIAYQVDVWKGRIQPAHNLVEFATFIMFFPQLVAGPIMRGNELLEQLRELPTPQSDRVARAGLRFGVGYFKKVVLVNTFLAPKVDTLFASMDTLSTAEAWAAVFLFGFQIYLDFSGYCDMAVGIAMLLGVKLQENFRTPYLARSPSEFWTRWNITLSRWIRDYIYIPIGGSRRKLPRNMINVVFAMTICGLWHGAAWGFVFWGLYHGCLIVLARAVGAITPRPQGKGLALLREGGAWLMAFISLQAGWAFFRVPDISSLQVLLGTMAGHTAELWGGTAPALWLLCAGLLLLHIVEEVGLRKSEFWLRMWGKTPAPLRGLVYLAILLYVLPYSFANQYEPFIYFQF